MDLMNFINFKNLINLKRKWIRFGLIPALLLGLWFVLTFWYIIMFDQSVLVISYNHSADNFTSITHNRLLKGQKLAGEFVAKDNNLGIVALRFKSFQRIPYKDEDILVFRLKEKGARSWYYQNQYRSGLTFDVPFLPFGFPKIADSRGKTYIFELESLKGNSFNGVALSSRRPFLVSKYQMDKSELLHNPRQLVSFLITKFSNSFYTIDITYSSTVFALLFLFYLFILIHPRILLPNYTFPILIISLLIIDIVYLQVLNDLLYLFIVPLWLWVAARTKMDSQYTFGTGLFLLAFSPLFLQLNNTSAAETAGAWAFMFFVAGLIQAMGELRSAKVKN